jgi:hypothetical protein
MPKSTSRNGWGTCSSTARIICSGVTPFAASAAITAPALVPTYTSNWLTLLSTANRSSARSAPTSYTAPVMPPPPSTSAVLDRRRRPRRVRAVPSRFTTLPILAHGVYGETGGMPPYTG